jgi:hypothetical protein
LSEIACQTILQGFNVSFAKDAKNTNCIPYNFHLGHYGLANSKHKNMKPIPCSNKGFPKANLGDMIQFDLVSKHNDIVSLTWSYIHKQWDNENPYENSIDWVEVQLRMKSKDFASFCGMTIDD